MNHHNQAGLEQVQQLQDQNAALRQQLAAAQERIDGWIRSCNEIADTLAAAIALLRARDKFGAWSRISPSDVQLLDWEEYAIWWGQCDDFLAAVDAPEPAERT